MVGELDAGNPHVQFDEGAQETCDSATRLCPTLPEPLAIFRFQRSQGKEFKVSHRYRDQLGTLVECLVWFPGLARQGNSSWIKNRIQ